jgi:hypothetical protein
VTAVAVAGSGQSRHLRFGLLLLLAAVLVAMRGHTYAEPIQRDLLIYAFIGEGLLHGGTLYDDWIDLKPPGPYLVFGVAGALLGIGHLQMFVLGVLLGLATLVGLYRLFAGPLETPWAGVGVAALWVVIGSDLRLEANEPNTEAFINAFLVWAVVGLLSLARDRVDMARAIGIGALFALATTFKHVAIVPAVLLCLAHLVVRREAFARAFAQCAIVGIVVAGTWVAMAAWFALDGRFEPFWDTLVRYPSEYGEITGRTVGANLIAGLSVERFFDAAMGNYAWGVLAVTAAAVIGAIAGHREWAYLLALVVGTYFAVAAPGWFFPHYDQLWLPVIAIGLGMALRQFASSRVPPSALAAATLALVTTIGVARTAPQYRLDAREWSEAKYQTIFTSAEDLGRVLGEVMHEDERLYVHGVLPNLYLAAGRRPATSVANIWFTFPDYGRRLAPRATAEALADLEATPPDVVVFDGFTASFDGPGLPLRDFLDQHYVVVAEAPGFAGFRLAVRRDADPDLVARIEAIPLRFPEPEAPEQSR